MAISEAYNRDCLKALKQMADQSIDLICADPPYGINITGKHRSQTVQVERERERERETGAACRWWWKAVRWQKQRECMGKAQKR